jgi:2-methylcitrate dehydratase PrpD
MAGPESSTLGDEIPMTTSAEDDARALVLPSSRGPGPTRRIAEHVAALRYEDLPQPLVRLLKQCVLDTLGVTIAASGLAPEARILRDYAHDVGGHPVASIFGFGGRVPAPWAVFVNGSLGHMVDYDDVGAGGHVSIATVPVALAIAEQRRGISGRALITAIAAGTDLHTRLNQAIRIPDWTMTEGWFPTQLFGYLSGAATAAKVHRMDADGVENTLGIAFTQVAGSRQMAVGSATHLRSMQAGFAGQAAVVSADLSLRGIVGSREVLEGRYGLFNSYVRTEPDWCAVTGGLGRDFPLLQFHGFKIWPACGYTRAPNAAIQILRTRHALDPRQVKSLVIVGGTGGTKLLCEPLSAKRRPKLAIDAKFSIPFTSAVMMLRGNVSLADYTDEALRDPEVLAMADKVSYRDDPEARMAVGGYSSLSRPTVEITMNDGRVFSETPDGMPGDPEHPVSDEILEAKFRDCAEFASKPLLARNIDAAVRLLQELEDVPDVTSIIDLLVPRETA